MNDEGRADELLEMAGRVADGAFIDWMNAEATLTVAPQRLRGLRLVERIARAHSDLVVLDGGESAAPGPEGLPFSSWGSLDLMAPIARGAFGDVFRAHDRRLERDVALKLLRPEARGTDSAPRFLQEARRLAGVHHPNVVTVFGVDRFADRDGLWMEWIEGETLEHFVEERGPLGAHEAALVGIDLCRALAAVHAAGLVHRDVKLTNVVRERGGRIVLMDFGSSTRPLVPGEDGAERLTGTPIYLAPEAFAGHDSGACIDIYALGVALYRLTSGEYPVRPGTVAEIAQQHRERAAVPLRDRNPALPTAFVRLVEHALAPDPKQRFPSAGAMERALDQFVSGSSEPAEAPRRSRLAPALAIGGALLAVALVAFAVARLWHWGAPADLDAKATFFRSNQERGTEERLTDGARISPGDQLFLEITASEPTWVYVIDEDANGHEFLLFPLDGLERGNPLPGGGTARLPGLVGGKEQAWDVTTAGGDESLLVVASRHPLAIVEASIRSLARSGDAHPAAIADVGLVNRLRGIGGLSPRRAPKGPGALQAIREQVTLRDGAGRDVRVFELRLANPE